MIKQTNRRLLKILGAFGLWSSMFIASANAGIINVNFDDLGTTTVDKISGLEWLDVTETRGLSVAEVGAKLNISSGPTANKGWRYATQADFFDMTSRWFDIDFASSRYSFNNTDVDLVDLFIGTFGDSRDAALDDQLASIDAAPGEHIATIGALADLRRGFSLVARVLDDDMAIRSSGTILSPGFDQINFASVANQTNDSSMGHFLVREFSDDTIDVSEPGTVALLGLGLIVLSATRTKRDGSERSNA